MKWLSRTSTRSWKSLILTGLILSCIVLTESPAFGHHEATPPVAIQKVKWIKQNYPDLYKRELARNKVSWNHLRKMSERRWYNQHPNNLETIYDYFRRTGDTYGTVQRTYDHLRLPSWKRNTYNCIAKRESGFRHNVWNGGAEGWPPPPGRESNLVNGVFQKRPAWANGYLAYLAGAGSIRYLNDVVTYNTYHVTSDPIASTIIAVRIGTGPFFAQSGSCF